MTTQQAAPQQFMQGIAIPATSVNPEAFMQKTRRQTLREAQQNYTTGMTQWQAELRKAGILASLDIRFTGKLTIDNGTGGNVDATSSWALDFLKLVRYTANGAANLISCSGLSLKARHYMQATNPISDMGVPRTVNGVQYYSGAFLGPDETSGVAPGQTAIPDGTYDVDITWHVPVAEDETKLVGASFLATSSADLTLNIDFAPITDLFTATGGATVELEGLVDVTSTKFSIPIGADGQIVVPDLSMFHSIIEAHSTGLQNGTNEVRLVGQGSGKVLLRTWAQILNGGAPLLLQDDKVANIAWAYGGAEQPETYAAAGVHRHNAADMYGSDVGGPYAVMTHDFVHASAFRDAVDMGTTNDLRWKFDITPAVPLTSARLRYAVETLFLAGQTVG